MWMRRGAPSVPGLAFGVSGLRLRGGLVFKAHRPARRADSPPSSPASCGTSITHMDAMCVSGKLVALPACVTVPPTPPVSLFDCAPASTDVARDARIPHARGRSRPASGVSRPVSGISRPRALGAPSRAVSAMHRGSRPSRMIRKELTNQLGTLWMMQGRRGMHVWAWSACGISS